MGDRRAHYSSGPRRGSDQHGGGGGGGRQGYHGDNKRKRDDHHEDDGMRALCYGLFYLGDRKQVLFTKSALCVRPVTCRRHTCGWITDIMTSLDDACAPVACGALP